VSEWAEPFEPEEVYITDGRCSHETAFMIIVKLLAVLVIGCSGEQSMSDRNVRSFLLELVESWRSAGSHNVETFADILETLKERDFEGMRGVDIREGKSFVSWMEWSERLTSKQNKMVK
jgi:hypothetical protein